MTTKTKTKTLTQFKDHNGATVIECTHTDLQGNPLEKYERLTVTKISEGGLDIQMESVRQSKSGWKVRSNIYITINEEQVKQLLDNLK